jgi:hypothetical protein
MVPFVNNLILASEPKTTHVVDVGAGQVLNRRTAFLEILTCRRVTYPEHSKKQACTFSRLTPPVFKQKERKGGNTTHHKNSVP